MYFCSVKLTSYRKQIAITPNVYFFVTQNVAL
jgi:hypothetical protein